MTHDEAEHILEIVKEIKNDMKESKDEMLRYWKIQIESTSSIKNALQLLAESKDEIREIKHNQTSGCSALEAVVKNRDTHLAGVNSRLKKLEEWRDKLLIAIMVNGLAVIGFLIKLLFN